jgi:hypothetical protein
MQSRMFLTALAVLGCLVATAQADTTIYQDSFHRNIDNGNGTFSPAPLAGSAPDVVNTGSAVWATHSQWNTVISTSGVGYASLNSFPTGDFSGFLPFTPEQGRVYTLSADFLMYASPRYEAGALGFAYAVSSPVSIANNGTAWGVERVNSDYSVSLGRGYAHYGAGTYGDFRLYQNISPSNPQSSWNDLVLHTFSVVLDTRSQYWTMSTSADGVMYASYDYSNAIGPAKNPGINYVGFSGTNALTVENFILTQRQFLAGDANGDGIVNGADLNTVLSNYNQTSMGWTQGDFNADSAVNGADLNVVLSNYNQSGGGVMSAVPEPNAILLVAAGLVGLLARAWRKRKLT